MWCLVNIIGAVIVAAATSFAYGFYFQPHLLVKAMLWFYRKRSGMQVKFIGDQNGIYCYGERGQKSKDRSSILFVHGYTSSKDQWVPSFKYLPKEYHLVAMELPGHGASSVPPESQNLDLAFSIETIKRFADLVGLTDKPFHIVGASLGGCMVGLFSAYHPELVERVTMICPAMRTPEDSEFYLQVAKAIELGPEIVQLHHCSLLPQTPQEMQKMLDSCLFHKPQVNKQILKGLTHLRSLKNSYYLRVFRELAKKENVDVLVNHCDRITAPSQLLWGAHDEIVHASGATLLQEKLPNCQDVTILENCGHSIDISRPRACCKAIVRFRGDAPEKSQ